MLNGVDVSNWQHPDGAKIDYALAVEHGVDFAIIEYRDEAGGVNPYFEIDHSGFKTAGAKTGSYVFLRPDLPSGPQAEDLRILEKLGPVWGDLEVNGGKNPRQLRAWWEQLTSSAPNVGMVSYPSFLEHYGPFPSISPLWVDSFGAAHVPSIKDETTLLWGTTDKANVPGIPTPVDLDAWTSTRAQFEMVFGVDANKPRSIIPPTLGSLVGMAGTPSGKGFLLCYSSGHVLPFGDATYHGSPNLDLIKVEGFMATPTGRGYRLVMSNGVIDNYGDARSEASVPLTGTH